ncbi:hypothetical protein TgHK011_004392 [Trichoderma gracile]|nr:hypothetical protein TgHK011_004392 [Trichoderma gracile]
MSTLRFRGIAASRKVRKGTSDRLALYSTIRLSLLHPGLNSCGSQDSGGSLDGQICQPDLLPCYDILDVSISTAGDAIATHCVAQTMLSGHGCAF